MASLTKPSEIARETLRLLAARRLAPSPDNYRALYNEVAGTLDETEPFPGRELKSLVVALPEETAGQQKLVRQFGRVFAATDWVELRAGLAELVKQLGAEHELSWSVLLADFLRQWEATHAGVTLARKREALDRVLAGAGASNEMLYSRLQGLVKSWAQAPSASKEALLVETDLDTAESSGGAGAGAAEPGRSGRPTASAEAADLAAELRRVVVFTLEEVIAAELRDEPDLAAEAKALAQKARTATARAGLEDLMAGIRRIAFRLELVAEDRAELRTGLQRLLQLLLENVGELVLEDRWLTGQIDVVREIVANPLNIRAIGEAESRLKEVIVKQSNLKHSLSEAKEALRQMLAGFIDQLAVLVDSTSEYHDKIEVCAQKISRADDLRELEDVLAEVMRETKVIQLNAQRSRDELRATRQRVEEAERRIGELQAELDQASAVVRHDQLTGALNRRGLEESYEKEVQRAQRRKSPLCLALLDIDDFKKLNDTLGHDAGDAALIHLATVIRESMRPQDTVARIGGEEFLIILPDTALADAETALVRLQRELTRRIFLHNNSRQLITFSAGVTDLRPDDTQASATKRADDAMYAAKRAGKNRVVLG